jgi:hypothetical protein
MKAKPEITSGDAAGDFDSLEKRLEEWTRKGKELHRALHDGRITELSAKGQHLLVRPIMMEQPGKGGECDAWFGLTYWDWRKLRDEGFDGFMETTPGSAHPKIMILVEEAARFIEERCHRQAAKRQKAGGLTEHTKVMRQRGRMRRQRQHANQQHA